MSETKEKILDSAEKLFAELGYSACSLRQIITDAAVNLAAIHYYFGTKEELLDEVLLRKLRPVNEARQALLERFEAEAAPAKTPLDRILEALLLPAADMAIQHPGFVRLMGRVHAEGLMPGVIQRHPQPVVRRFLDSLRAALPELPEQEFAWRTHFMFGAMGHALAWGQQAGSVDGPDLRRRMMDLVAFTSGGFRAPVTVHDEAEVTR